MKHRNARGPRRICGRGLAVGTSVSSWTHVSSEPLQTRLLGGDTAAAAGDNTACDSELLYTVIVLEREICTGSCQIGTRRLAGA